MDRIDYNNSRTAVEHLKYYESKNQSKYDENKYLKTKTKLRGAMWNYRKLLKAILINVWRNEKHGRITKKCNKHMRNIIFDRNVVHDGHNIQKYLSKAND